MAFTGFSKKSGIIEYLLKGCDMWTREYGKTGKEITVISFGGMQFPEPQNIEAMAELVYYAYQRGINYFDTAPMYCQDKSEDIIGTAIKRMEPGTFYVSTKCMKADGDELRKSLEKSLKRLNVEKIDFFHIWCILTLDAWEKRIAGGAVEAALKAKEEGLIEHLVASSHLPGNELRQLLSNNPLEGVTVGYCAINFPYREEGLAAAREMDLGVVTMNPLGGGLIPQNAERFTFLMGPEDKSVVEAALRFNVSNPAVTSALVGFSTKQHVDEAVDAIENFKPYGQDRIEAIRNKVVESFNDLCTGCGYCLPCPEGLEIPKLMDAYNRKILGGNKDKHITDRLYWHWSIKPQSAQGCSLCGECEERCTQHLPIRERMQEIAVLPEKEEP
jgi:predicted aldo/keto reductase-like oxidoreductase